MLPVVRVEGDMLLWVEVWWIVAIETLPKVLPASANGFVEVVWQESRAHIASLKTQQLDTAVGK